MHDENKIKALRDLIHSAQTSINSAKKIINSLLNEDSEDDSLEYDTSALSVYNSWDIQIVEWVFTGDAMLGPDGNTYPVPQNYASKSLLVQGSKLKAIIEQNGKIKYKIIGEIPYETQIGIITKNGDKYQINTDKKTYNVLMAAITFHKCDIWDSVTIRIPEGKNATYAVIEAVIPKN
jgi:hypothetical protein